MKLLNIISEEKSYFNVAFSGNQFVFRTFDSLIAWDFLQEKASWEYVFESDGMMGAKPVLLHQGLAISYSQQNYQSLLVAVDLKSGEPAWNVILDLAIQHHGFLLFGNSIHLFGSDKEGKYLTMQVDAFVGNLTSTSSAIPAEFLFQYNGLLYLAGLDGIFRLLEDGEIIKVNSTGIYAICEANSELVLLWENIERELCLGFAGDSLDDLKICEKVSSAHSSTWEITQISLGIFLASNNEAGNCFIVNVNDSERSCLEITEQKGLVAIRMAKVGDNYFAVAMDPEEWAFSLAKIDPSHPAIWERKEELAFPRNISAVNGFLLIGSLGGIEIWQP